MILVSLTKSLGTETVTVTATLRRGGATITLPGITFDSYTEHGATLPLYTPPLGPGATSVRPFTLRIRVSVQPASGPAETVSAADLGAYVAFRGLEGNMGKMLLLLTQEKARIRREGRQLAAAKLLNTARLDALDRIGADLGVPRFRDDLVFDRDHQELMTVMLTDSDGNPVAESDADYARRLSIYRSFLLSSGPRIHEMLNGPGESNDPNAGLLSELGLTSRFAVSDDNNPFAIAIRIVGVDSEEPRTSFLNYVRSDILTWLPSTVRADAVHAKRYEPSARRAAVSALRARLRDFYQFPTGAAVAPALAQALDRLGRVLRALGHSSQLTIMRAQDPTAAGSRYELGLGVDVASLSATVLNTLAAAVNDTARAPTDDKESEVLIAGTRPAPAADDPDGRWLLTACGFQTIHRLDTATLYLSHAPILGLVIDGPPTVDADVSTGYVAHFYPPEDPAINAALLSGLESAMARWAAANEAAWTQLTPVQQSAAWNEVVAQPPNGPAMLAVAAAGLPAIPDPTGLITGIGHVPVEMVATISLDSGLASAILAGDPAAAPTLGRLVQTLKNAGLASAVPLVTSTGAVLLAVSVLGLPQIGVNLAERRSSGFRWYTVSLGGTGSAGGFGSSTDLRATTAGALALVCLGYVREGSADPYEVTLDLPDDATLTLKQYEFLMNTLAQVCPVGIQINTYAIRRGRVDLDGDTNAEPLTAAVSKSYRSFVRTRLRGAYQQGPQHNS